MEVTDAKKTGAPVVRAFNDTAKEVCRQFNTDPNEVYPIGDPTAELPPVDMPPAEIPPAELPAVEDIKPDLKKQLDDIIGNKDTDAKDKKTAEELKARLEELEKATENAQKFIDEKATPPAETTTDESGTPPVPPVAS